MAADGLPMTMSAGGRRIDLALEPALRLGPLTVDPSAREVVRGERRELLEPRIMQVLVRLARTPGVVVSRDALIASCWDGRIVGDDAINRVIAKLRRLSEQDEGAAFTIETIARVGYRLWTPEPEVEPEPAPVPATAAVAVECPKPPAAPAGPVRRPWRIIGGLGLLLLLLAGGGLYAARMRPAPAPAISLVVLPFEDLSPGRDQAHFAEGVAEEIQSVLAQTPGLTVIGRTSARRFKDEADLAAIRRALNVTHVLEGSVRTQGRRVRMSVRLVRAQDGRQVWAGEVEEPSADVFAAQDAIGASVAEALRGRFGRGEAAAPAERTDIKAYDLVLAARARLRERRPDDIQAALGLLRRATALDADYGPAWAALAEATLLAADRVDGAGRIPVRQARADAFGFAQRAVKLAPDRAEGYAALARAADPGPEAIEAARTAVRLDPSNAEMRVRLSELLRAGRDYRGAVEQLRAAIAFDPLYARAYSLLAYGLAQLGDAAEAEAVVRRFDTLRPEPARGAVIRAHLAAARGDWSETVRFAEAAHAEKDALYVTDLLGRTYRLLGLRDRATSLQGLASQPFEASIYARDDDRALTLVAAAQPAFWEDPIRSWMAADVLTRAGRSAMLLAAFDQRYGTAEAYCRRGEHSAATRFASAMVADDRQDDAARVLDCVQAGPAAAYRAGQLRGANSFTLAEIAALKGQSQAALTWLERAYEHDFRGALDGDLADNAALRSLSGQPRFEAVRAKILAHVARERRETLARPA